MILTRILKARQHRRGKAPKRVLLAWEYGAGYTHVANLLAVAAQLRAAGVACFATLYDTRHSDRFAALGIPVVQNHLWPQARRWVRHSRERSYVGFLDVLGNLGFAEPDWVAAALAHYASLFDLFQPDLVLAENAYGAQLAARGRLPAMAFGFGEYLPVVQSGNFVFPESEPTSWSADEIMAGIGRGLETIGRPPLLRLEEMFDIEAIFPFGPHPFDRNAPLRREPPLPAYVEGFRPGLRAQSGGEIFVYLHATEPWASSLMPALLDLGRPIRAYIPELDARDRALLAERGVMVENGPIAIERIVERSRCVLHHGGVGLTAACLSGGLPQVVLSKQPDQRAGGDFIAREGFGAHQSVWTATAAWIVQATRRAYDDDALHAMCRSRRREFDSWFAFDPTRLVAREALRVLGHARRGEP